MSLCCNSENRENYISQMKGTGFPKCLNFTVVFSMSEKCLNFNLNAWINPEECYLASLFWPKDCVLAFLNILPLLNITWMFIAYYNVYYCDKNWWKIITSICFPLVFYSNLNFLNLTLSILFTEPSDGDLHGCLSPLPPEHSGGYPISPTDLDCWHSRHLGIYGHCRIVLFLCKYITSCRFCVTLFVHDIILSTLG